MCTPLEISNHNPHHFLLLIPIRVHSSMLPVWPVKPKGFVTLVSGYVVLPALGFWKFEKCEHNN